MSDLVWGYWLKVALRANVPFSVFWDLSPKKLQPFIDVHKEKIEENLVLLDTQSHMTGSYVLRAIGASFGKNKKYPEKPVFYASDKNKERMATEEMTVEQKAEIAARRFEIYAQAFNAANNFD